MKPEDYLAFRTAYDGGAYMGSQSQLHGKTVQDQFEKAIFTLFKLKTRLGFTSRTDSGVHAYDQIFFLKGGARLWLEASESSRRRMRLSLNAILGPKIRVWEIGLLKAGFSPKEHVLWKEYRYQILQSPFEDPLGSSRQWWVRLPLSDSKLRSALHACEGNHDFAGFSKASSVKKFEKRGTNRRVLKAEFKKTRHSTFSEANLYEIRVRGEGFMHQMVRGIVGTSVEIALGENFSINEMLRGGVHAASGCFAPANALTLFKTRTASGWYRKLHAALPS